MYTWASGRTDALEKSLEEVGFLAAAVAESGVGDHISSWFGGGGGGGGDFSFRRIE
jgi:hypothetical protein